MAQRLFYLPAAGEAIGIRFMRWAEVARARGLLSLEEEAALIAPDTADGALLKSGLELVINGTEPELTRHILNRRIETLEIGLAYRWDVWRGFLVYLLSGPTRKAAARFLEASMLVGHRDYALLESVIGELISAWPEDGNRPFPEGPPANFQAHPLTHSNLRLLAVVEPGNELMLEKTLHAQFEAYRETLVDSLKLVVEGCLSIQSGDNPMVMAEVMGAMLGVELRWDGPEGDLPPNPPDLADMERELDEILEPGAVQFGLDDFEEILFDLDDVSMQRLVRDVPHRELARALAWAPEALRDRVLVNLGGRVRTYVNEAMDISRARKDPDREKEIQSARIRVLGVLQRLLETGEIALDGE